MRALTIAQVGGRVSGLPWRITLLAFIFAFLLPLHILTAQSKASKSRYELAYATYFGGDEFDQAREVILYPDGSVLIAGQTNSSNLSTTSGVVQATYAGDDPSLGPPGIYGGDCYLARLSRDGQKILFASYFGGSKQERNVYGMALDKSGNIVITSTTRSPDMRTTEGCFQPKYGGGTSDWFVAKLSGDCKRLLWCTYVGGSGDESPRGGLALDGQDNVYVVGGTDSSDFPTTPGVFQRARRGTRDAAIVKLRPDGSGLVFGTLLGGDDWDGTMGARVDVSGDVYIAGHTQSSDFPANPDAAQSDLGGQSDCYLAKLSSDASRMLYSTYVGGRGNEFAEHRPWLFSDGTVLLCGSAGSIDFPTTEGAYQRALKGSAGAFLTKLSADGKSFVFSTLLGGSGSDFSLMPTPGPNGAIFLVGQTASQDFPVTLDALQPQYGGGPNDGFVAIINPDGTRLLYASYVGGSGDDMVRSVTLGPYGEVFLVGSTSSADFRVTPNATQTGLGGKTDAFVVKLIPSVGYDVDADAIPDAWEREHFADDYGCDPGHDPDFDGLTNLEEYRLGTVPTQSDTDGDGAADRHEVLAGTDPLDAGLSFRVVHIGYAPSGAEIEWSVIADRRYQVYLSGNLEEWSSLGNVRTASAQDLLLSAADLLSPEPAKCFYKVQALP